MCIFCLADDAPFYLRKSTAFPRQLIAEAIETDGAPGEKAKSGQSVSAMDEASLRSDVPQGRTLGPVKDHDNT